MSLLTKEQWVDVSGLHNFALKLGYSPNQIQAVFDRLGPKITQNEMLSELVKIGNAVDDRTNKDEDKCWRQIVIDGENVAVNYGNKECYCCRGIKICVDWFKKRGHKEITVFTPSWWRYPSPSDLPIKGIGVIEDLSEQGVLCVSCCDHRALLKYVAQVDGVLVSNDTYAKLLENSEYRDVVEKRLLMYSFVSHRFMPPDDPLGRRGPPLEKFLEKPKYSYTDNDHDGEKIKYENKTTRRCYEDERVHPKWNKSPIRAKKANETDKYQYTNAAITRVDSTSEITLSTKLRNLKLTSKSSDCIDHISESKPLSEPSCYSKKIYNTKSSSSSSGKFYKHQKVRRQSYHDFDEILKYKNYWESQPAERPFENGSMPQPPPQMSQERWFRWSERFISHPASRQPIMPWTSDSSLLSEDDNYCTVPNRRNSVELSSSHNLLRDKLHFHLSAIFPKEQVETVLNIYPDETNPQKLCSAILSLFPNG